MKALLARMKEASVASTMVASNVSVITPAETPYKPWMPKPLLFLALALVIGSMGGVMTAFFVEYLDNSIKTTDELEKICHIPALGVVPLFSENSKKLVQDRTGIHRTHPLLPTHVDAQRGHLSYPHCSSCSQPQRSRPKSIMVTSANPNEGKTTISLKFSCCHGQPGPEMPYHGL